MPRFPAAVSLFPSRILAPAVGLTAVALFSTFCCPPVSARQEGAKPAGATAPPQGDAVQRAVFVDIYELNLLQSLVPLKLTQTQKDRILVALKEVLEADKERRAKDTEALKEIAPEVAKAKAAALEGTTVSAETKARIEDMSKAADARLLQARRAAVGKLLPVLRGILTEAQKEEIDAQSVAFFGGKRVPAKYRDKPNDAPRAEVIDLSLTAYIERVLLDDATIGLLTRLKPAPESAAAAAAENP